MTENGTTLLELMLAVAIMVILVSMVTLSLPKASKSLSVGRYRLLASSYASEKIQEMKALPYDYVPAATTSSDANCNCNNVVMSASAYFDNSTTDNSTVYNRYVCVNLVQSSTNTQTLTPVCADGTSGPSGRDRGLKNIRVRVEWSLSAGDTYYTEAESLVRRL
jgi:type II secretory pathway pseudopilin PulG